MINEFRGSAYVVFMLSLGLKPKHLKVDRSKIKHLKWMLWETSMKFHGTTQDLMYVFIMIFFPLSSSGSHSYHSWCYRSYLCFTISCLLKFGRNCCLANLGSHCCLWDCTQGLCCNLLRFVPSLLLSTKGIMIIPTLTIWRCNSDSFSLTANWFTCQVTTYVVTRPGRELLFTVVSQDEKYKAKVCLLESSYFKILDLTSDYLP